MRFTLLILAALATTGLAAPNYRPKRPSTPSKGQPTCQQGYVVYCPASANGGNGGKAGSSVPGGESGGSADGGKGGSAETECSGGDQYCCKQDDKGLIVVNTCGPVLSYNTGSGDSGPPAPPPGPGGK